jgi:lipid-A-disaccharide synthase
LLGVPQVVAYRVNGFTYFMAKLLVKLRWVSLVNILLNQGLLVEHLQDVSPERLTKSLQELDAQRDRMDEGYRALRDLLSVGDGSTASDGVVRGILREVGQ